MWELRARRPEGGRRVPPADPRRRAEGAASEHGVDDPQHAQARHARTRCGASCEVYNEAWGDNWGFVPITDAEVEFQAKNLKQVLDEDWAFIAEKDGEVVGAALTLPDINQVLAKMNGRLLPFGWLHFLLGKRKIDRVRVFALGVKHELPAHRRRRRPLPRAPRDRRTGPADRGGETGWILETNEPMNRGHGGDGRQDRQALPGLREGALDGA